MYDLKFGEQQTLGNLRHEACWTKKYGELWPGGVGKYFIKYE